jgi:hypothetical protein
MPKLFEQSEDTNPLTSFRLAFGKAATATFNITLANFLAWLQANLNFTPGILHSVEDLGDWDMNVSVGGDVEIVVTHNIADYKKIRSITVVILDDTDSTVRYFLISPAGTGVVPQGAVVSISSASVLLRVLTGGRFDSATFDATSYNRGYMLIEAIP